MIEVAYYVEVKVEVNVEVEIVIERMRDDIKDDYDEGRKSYSSMLDLFLLPDLTRHDIRSHDLLRKRCHIDVLHKP